MPQFLALNDFYERGLYVEVAFPGFKSKSDAEAYANLSRRLLFARNGKDELAFYIISGLTCGEVDPSCLTFQTDKLAHLRPPALNMTDPVDIAKFSEMMQNPPDLLTVFPDDLEVISPDYADILKRVGSLPFSFGSSMSYGAREEVAVEYAA